MDWYSYLSKNFSQFVVIYTVKGFSIVNEAEVDVFLEFSYFFYDTILKVKLLRHVRLFATPWTVAHQACQSMGFSR